MTTAWRITHTGEHTRHHASPHLKHRPYRTALHCRPVQHEYYMHLSHALITNLHPPPPPHPTHKLTLAAVGCCFLGRPAPPMPFGAAAATSSAAEIGHGRRRNWRSCGRSMGGWVGGGSQGHRPLRRGITHHQAPPSHLSWPSSRPPPPPRTALPPPPLPPPAACAWTRWRHLPPATSSARCGARNCTGGSEVKEVMNLACCDSLSPIPVHARPARTHTKHTCP